MGNLSGTELQWQKNFENPTNQSIVMGLKIIPPPQKKMIVSEILGVGGGGVVLLPVAKSWGRNICPLLPYGSAAFDC
jgi:hypothetical protein